MSRAKGIVGGVKRVLRSRESSHERRRICCDTLIGDRVIKLDDKRSVPVLSEQSTLTGITALTVCSALLTAQKLLHGW
jgi:hypothetical protein